MSEWKETQIKDFGKVITGYTPSTHNLNLWGGEIPFYSPADFNDDVYCSITERKVKPEALSNDRIVQEDSLMVTCIASIGKIALAKIKGISNQQINTIIFNDAFEPAYCYYLLKYNINELLKLAGTTAVPIVNKTEFKKIKLKHHSNKAEQRKIAHILSTVDAVIEKTQAAIAKYKAIKQGMLHDLFTRGIDIKTGKLRPRYEDAPELYKESSLGFIPVEWEEKCLTSLCSEKPTYGINAAAVDFIHQLPTYIRITDIDEDGNFLKTGRKCVDSLYSNQYILKKGDLVFARTGATVGKTYLYNEADGLLVFAGFLIKVSPNEKLLDSNFLKFLTETPYYLNWIGLMSQRSGQPGINGNEYGNFLIPNPDLNEQKIISERLLSIQNKLHTEQNYLHKLQQLKAGLMEDLLRGKKTVNLKETELA